MTDNASQGERDRQAHREGYFQGFVDARYPEGFDGDERDVWRQIDEVALSEGWDAVSDSLPAVACRHGSIPPESCLQRLTRGCPEGDAAALKAQSLSGQDMMGASLRETGSRPTDQAPTGLDASRFDPARIEQLEKIVRDTLWMAQRYADGRKSYAVGLYNDAARAALRLGVVRPSADTFAIDGMQTAGMSGLSPQEFAIAIEARQRTDPEEGLDPKDIAQAQPSLSEWRDSPEIVERVAKAICAADQGQWRERTERLAPGLPPDYDFDRLNNHWRHIARAALSALPEAPK